MAKHIIIAFALLSLAAQAAARPATVVATIAPLHSLVQGVIGDDGDVRLLSDARHSPHGLRLKPSQMQALQDAAVVFYVDEALESYVRKIFKALPESVRRVPLAREVLPPRNEAGGDNFNLHVWLDPRYAASIASIVARELGKAWPEKHALYEANAQALIARLEALDQSLREHLAAVRDKPFVVLHDAYLYFAHRYELAATVVADMHDHGHGHGHGGASVRELHEIEETIRETGAVCVFHEPQFPERMKNTLRELAEDTGVGFGVLDVLGAGLEPGPDLYFRLMENLSTELARCLSR